MAAKLKGRVAVITGASSGIGRATALAFAAKGTKVVVAARREQALNDLVAEIERTGEQALAVPTDVTDEQAVLDLANAAIQAFGRIDIWVNDAGVILYGSVTDTPMADVRRLMEVNFIGHVHGARAALPVFREQGSGTLINLSSVVTRLPQPYASAYVASKHAVHALSESLRQELMLAGDKDIHVVNVLPAAIDTPLFQHGGNYTGRRPVPPPPVYPVDVVAKAIIKAATRPKRDIHAGRAGHLVNLQAKFMPGMVERTAAMLVDKGGFEDTRTASTSGNLFEPMTAGADVSGGWKPSGPSKARRLATASALAVPLAALGRTVWKRNQQ
ncbi:MAG: SDR family oxidoreductase [Chloroflexota bacterium]|nr:SDR family oxidoreductase [Chloroflexota bacterium]